MATGGEEAPCSSEGLICPLCQDIFDDATLLSCGHTFCRKCLKRYDASHQDRDHMVCPLCRSDTRLQENRVEGLLANVMVNGLVDEYHSNQGEPYASLELKVMKCSLCLIKGDAMSFCKQCNDYMCDNCHKGFEDHQEVQYMSEVSKFSTYQHSEMCPIHSQESKDLFCEECKVSICSTCVIVAHRDHKIKNQPDFERELRLNVDSLLERCKARETELEKNIQNTKVVRQEVHMAIEKLETEVRDAYEKKARQLKENERLLLENLQSLKKGFDDDIDVLKSKDCQRIKIVVSLASHVNNDDRHGCLQGDTFAAHCLVCDGLERILKEFKDDGSARVITETAREKVFRPAHESLLHLGEITEIQSIEVAQDMENRPTLRIKKTVDLRGWVSGMTVTDDDVIVGYKNVSGGDKVDSHGNTSQHFLRDGHCSDLAHQSHSGNTVVSRDHNTLKTYSQSASHIHTKHIENKCNSWFPKMSSNHKDEIIIANREDHIMIYDPSISTELCSVTTKAAPHQAFETRSGAIIASTCHCTNPSKVMVYDRSGREGDILTAYPGRYLYAAVDSRDRVYVASVNCRSGKVVFTQYKMDGLKLKKVFKFNELMLTLGDVWCYMVSISCDMLAFASGTMLHFIEVHVP